MWSIVLKPGPARRVDPGPGRPGHGTGPGLSKNPPRSWSGETRSTRNPAETRPLFFFYVDVKWSRFKLSFSISTFSQKPNRGFQSKSVLAPTERNWRKQKEEKIIILNRNLSMISWNKQRNWHLQKIFLKSRRFSHPLDTCKLRSNSWYSLSTESPPPNKSLVIKVVDFAPPGSLTTVHNRIERFFFFVIWMSVCPLSAESRVDIDSWRTLRIVQRFPKTPHSIAGLTFY